MNQVEHYKEDGFSFNRLVPQENKNKNNKEARKQKADRQGIILRNVVFGHKNLW